MLIRTLSEYEDKFLYYINKWNKELTRYDDTKWFDTDLPWCIQNRYKQYEDWTFVVTDDNEEELVGFAAVQDFGNNCARILTRLYYNPKYRLKHVGYDMNNVTPANIITKHQVEKFKHKKHLFWSVEYMRRRKNAIRLSQKLNNFYGYDFNVLPDLYKTYNKDEQGAWQSISLYSLVNEPFPLEALTIKEWKQRYE